VTTPKLLKTFLLVFALTSIVQQLFLCWESRQQYTSQIFESNKAPGYVPGIDKDWAAFLHMLSLVQTSIIRLIVLSAEAAIHQSNI